MTISYNWLSQYLPYTVEPSELSNILTSIGLEVESLEQFESIKGSLDGVVIAQVNEVRQHPNADKLKLTKVNIGSGDDINIVCGASNVAAGQKVLVATVGATIYPTGGLPLTIKAAKIRGEESAGMICAEDEIGLGTSHAGIMVLPDDAVIGTPAATYFAPYSDWVYEIGLTPNRMDAMSHLGVAKDVCAYLSHHSNKLVQVINPLNGEFKVDDNSLPINVSLESDACARYAGVTISGLTVKESPQWLKDKLLAIGQRPINNIVDITNFILHETGQPLHAFDARAIEGNTIIVRNAVAGETFVTLDEKSRTLNETDLLIANRTGGMCLAGVFGGISSGVKANTTKIFLESAWFNPVTIRKTSFRHQLRTEAAARFEKGVDISNATMVLKHAARLIKQVAGGFISSEIVDLYPQKKERNQVKITYTYLQKLTGNTYRPEEVINILQSLGFDIIENFDESLVVAVPFSKPDITLPADIVEEILRIDGLDNVAFKASMTITPAIDESIYKENLREKISGFLTGQGFNEIVTNSITNSKYYRPNELTGAVNMLNSLSADLDVMRPSLLETGLETIAYNVNRKNKDLLFFEFGKSYHTAGVGNYSELEHIALYITGELPSSFKKPAAPYDLYFAKGIATSIIELCGLKKPTFLQSESENFLAVVLGQLQSTDLVSVGAGCRI